MYGIFCLGKDSMMIGNLITKIYLKRIEKKGFVHGTNFDLEKGANIDAPFCNLISCGDNVTLAKDVYILAHDASMKKCLGKTKVGKVSIGDNVFVGAKSVILPGVEIGDKVIVGANSTVTKSIPSGEIWAGTPAKCIGKYDDFVNKHKEQMNAAEKCGTEAWMNHKIQYTD